MAPASAIEILLVEDNPGDILLTQEALKEAKVMNHLHVVNDGEKGDEIFKKRSGVQRCHHT